MFSHMKTVVNRFTHAFGSRDDEDCLQPQIEDSSFGRLTSSLVYQRPLFLGLSKEEEQQILNHKTRCAVLPKSSNSLPFNSGYCEVINAGKSTLNEDCAVALTVFLDSPSVEHCTCELLEKEVSESTVEVSSEITEKSALDEFEVPPEKHEKSFNQSSSLQSSDNGNCGDANNLDSANKSNLNNDEIVLTKPVLDEDVKHTEGFATDDIAANTGECTVGNDATLVNEVCDNDIKHENEVLGTYEHDPEHIDTDFMKKIVQPAGNHGHFCGGADDLSSNLSDLNFKGSVFSNETEVTEPVSTKFESKQSVSADKICCKCQSKSLRVDYFALFDGHAGEGAALYASNVLHEVLIERLREIQHLLPKDATSTTFAPACLSDGTDPAEASSIDIPSDTLITGLLQDVMCLTDKHMKYDQEKFKFTGGCTALLVVFIIGKMFVAGAGDCRAVLCRSLEKDEAGERTADGDGRIATLPMSQDFTPHTERRRLQYLAYVHPILLGGHFSRIEFIRRVTPVDVGKKVLHRDYHMTGWSYKKVTEEDLKHPMISGNGKAKRLLATIGVTRGLGDHTLKALNQLEDVPVKPFMSSVPEIRMYDLTTRNHCNYDVLIVASDGLWDVISNEMATKVAVSTLQSLKEDDPSRYCKVAKKLVVMARGEKGQDGLWRMTNGRPSSFDDISVFVIPLHAASSIHR